MLTTLTTGMLLGLTAGIAPGPLLTLVIRTTLRSGMKQGVKTALAPALTDAPIILAALLLANILTADAWPLGLVSIAGSFYVGWLAWETLTVDHAVDQTSPAPRALRQAMTVNFLNPHPYLFWFTVGIALMKTLWADSAWLCVLWLAGFYTMLIGSKIALAIICSKTRSFLTSKGFIWVNRFLAGALAIFAVVLFMDGLDLMG